MPKLKTNRGAAKRFRATASGYKARRTNRNHILTKKATKRKRQLRASAQIGQSDLKSIDRMLPFAINKTTKRRRHYRAKDIANATTSYVVIDEESNNAKS